MTISDSQQVKYQSSYIVDKSPGFYGGKQEEYLSMAEAAIENGVNDIREGMSCKVDPTQIFHNVVKNLQKARHKIACKHQPEKAKLFGVRRDSSELSDKFTTPFTALYRPYDEYNQKFLKLFTKILHKIPHDLKTFSKTTAIVKEKVMGKNCFFQIELLDAADLSLKKFDQLPSKKELHEALEIDDKSPLEITKDYSLMKRLKTEHKHLYDRIVFAGMLQEINTLFPSPVMRGRVNVDKVVRYELKNIYILGTIRLELEPGKMFCIARHFTWLYQDWRQDPIDRMMDHSVDFIIHQDPFLVERTMNACGRIFADALAWNSESDSLDSLKERIALLRFTYGNSMPCSRGDGSVGDWLELALYRYHGFTSTRHETKQLPCFELFSSILLSNYIKNYKKTIIVE